MKNASRRRVLALVSTLSVGSGCLGGSSKPLGLRKIELINLSDEQKEVGVSVQKGGEIVYDNNHTVEESPTNNRVEITQDWMGDRTQYEVTVSTKINGDEMSSTAGSNSLNGEFGNKSCFQSVVIIDNDKLGITHGYYESCEVTE